MADRNILATTILSTFQLYLPDVLLDSLVCPESINQSINPTATAQGSVCVNFGLYFVLSP